jgi:hypothetical protein
MAKNIRMAPSVRMAKKSFSSFKSSAQRDDYLLVRMAT